MKLWTKPYNRVLPDGQKQILDQTMEGWSVEQRERQFRVVSGLVSWIKSRDSTRKMQVLGVAGPQGSGKSVLARQLVAILEAEGISALVLSLDDYYLTRMEREKLALEVHPLLKTRGVPGTHDMKKMLETIRALGKGSAVALPVFDKARDDRREESLVISSSVTLLILEGWCLGARPQTEEQLDLPINKLEAENDPDLGWRRYVNNQLGSKTYQQVWSLVDDLLFLKSPSFTKVFEWRWQQEQELREKIKAAKSVPEPELGGTNQGLMTPNQGLMTPNQGLVTPNQGLVTPNQGLMTPTQLHNFLMHYERITRHMMDSMPAEADLVFHLNDRHEVEKINLKNPGTNLTY